MSDDGKLLALYLMTCSHNTIAGVFRLPDGYIAEDMGWDSKRVSEGFVELFRNGFAERCPDTKWVWIVKHLEWNPPENPNQWKATVKVFKTVPNDCVWRARFFALETVVKQLNNLSVSVPVSVKGVQGDETGGESHDAKPKTRRLASVKKTIPADFAVSERVLKWASERGISSPVVELHREAFVSICKANGYAYADWDAAFMNAVRANWAKIQPQQRPADEFAGCR